MLTGLVFLWDFGGYVLSNFGESSGESNIVSWGFQGDDLLRKGLEPSRRGLKAPRRGLDSLEFAVCFSTTTLEFRRAQNRCLESPITSWTATNKVGDKKRGKRMKRIAYTRKERKKREEKVWKS